MVFTEAEKLYSPLNFHLRDKEDAQAGVYDDIHYWRDGLSHEEAFGYLDNIAAHLSRDRQSYDNGRGLAEYLRSDVLEAKVQSLVPGIELLGDKLWMVADIRLTEPLTQEEMAELKDWWSGQLSDGWGEGIEQREIKVGRGDLYIEPWTPSDDFFIDTEREFRQRLGLEPLEQPPLTPAQAALYEPDIYDDEATATLRELLITRLDANLLSYFDDIHSNEELSIPDMSSEIAAVTGAHYYLSEIHNFHTSELQYLLQFKDPLAVVADEFQVAGMDDYSDIMWKIFDRQDAIEGDYELMPNAPGTPGEAVLKEELFGRLDKNLSDYTNTILRLDKMDIIGKAGEIAAVVDAHFYLTDHHSFDASELDYLLKFQNPLEVVSDVWVRRTEDIGDMSYALQEVFDKQDALQGDYALAEDEAPAAETSAQEAVDRQDELFGRIAKEHCRFETLETRNRDSLDFREVSVWGIKAALEEAYYAGMTHQLERTKGAEPRGADYAAPDKSPAAEESARDVSPEKRSVLEQIREAAKATKEPRKDKPARDKSGPEL